MTTSAPEVLFLGRDWHARLSAEARRAAPAECCGLLVGAPFRDGDGREGLAVTHAITSPNIARAAGSRFQIDPEIQFETQRYFREQGLSIIGCYHSHPQGQMEPSDIDREGMTQAGLVWLILACPEPGQGGCTPDRPAAGLGQLGVPAGSLTLRTQLPWRVSAFLAGERGDFAPLEVTQTL